MTFPFLANEKFFVKLWNMPESHWLSIKKWNPERSQKRSTSSREW